MFALQATRTPRFVFVCPFTAAELHVRGRPRLHVSLIGSARVQMRSSIFARHAELHVRRSRLQVRLVGLACVRLTCYTRASIA